MANTNASSVIYGTFLDVAKDAKPWMNIPSTNTTKDANIELILDMACQWVSNFIGHPVQPQKFTYRFDGFSGWTGAYLNLPYTPVLEVTSVVEYWGAAGPHVLTESTPTNQTDGYQVEYSTGRLIRIFPGNVQKPWFPGSRNIEISWTAGYNPIPADIRMATLELAKHWYDNTQMQAGIRGGVGIPMSGEYDPAATSGLFTGIPYRIIDLLETYIQVGIG